MWKKCKNNNNLRATRSAGAGETHEMCVNMFCGREVSWWQTDYFQKPFVWQEGGTGWKQQDAQLVERLWLRWASPHQSDMSHFFYSSHSATQCRSQRHNLPGAEGLHAHTRFKLANEMQQHVVLIPLPSPPLSYKACGETMVTLSRGLLFAVHW